jgi:hypothetical protein
MDSKTYVNEIDISKIKNGQEVRVGIDAFPDKKYTGQVISVANVGEQLKNADAKVFEVVIRLRGTDPILRPAMTTSNQIVTASYKDVVFIPIEALFGNDTMTYVYKSNGIQQVVVAGEMNENYRIIEQGLQEGDELYLSAPENVAKFKLVGEELIPIIKQRKAEKEREDQLRLEEAQKAEEARRNARQNFRRGGGNGGPGGGMPQGMTMQGAPPQGASSGTQVRERPQGAPAGDSTQRRRPPRTADSTQVAKTE